jgi:SSS family solute:Na+ symporter
MTALLTNTYFWVVAIYFMFVIVISFLTKKVASRSVSDFLIAGRNMGTLFCAVVVACEWLGGMSTIGISERAFTKLSFEPILYNVSTATGMLIIGFTVAKHYRRNNIHTVSEMLEKIIGREAKKISAIAFLIAYIVLAYVQLQTATSVINAIFDVNLLAATIIAAAIITVYTYIGGMHALAITAVIHTIVMFLSIGAAMVIGLSQVNWFSGLQEILSTNAATVGRDIGNIYNPFSASWSAAVALFVGGVFGGMAAQASIQPIFGAKDEKTAKKAAILSSAFIAPFGIMTAILGLIAATGKFISLETTMPKHAMTTLLTTPEFINPILGGLAIAGIFAAILSTVGPVNFAVVTIATKDIYQGFINPDADEKKVLKMAKNLVILVSLITIPLAYFMSSGILDTAYISYAIRAIGAIVILVGIYARGWLTALGVKIAFIGGTVAVFVCVIAETYQWFTFNKTYGAIIFAVVSLIIGYFVEKYGKKE